MPLLPSHTLVQTYSLVLLTSAYLLLTSPLTVLNSPPLWLLGESMRIRSPVFLPSPAQLAAATAAKTTTHGPGITLSQVNTIPNASDALLSTSTRELLALLALVLLIAGITQSVLATGLRYSSSQLTSLAASSFGASGSRKPRIATLTKEKQAQLSAFAEKIYNLYSTQTLFLTLAALRVVLEGAFVGCIYLLYADRSPQASRFGAAQARAGKLDETLLGLRESQGVMGLLANRVVFAVGMADMLFWGYLWTVLRDEAREVAGFVATRQRLEQEMEME